MDRQTMEEWLLCVTLCKERTHEDVFKCICQLSFVSVHSDGKYFKMVHEFVGGYFQQEVVYKPKKTSVVTCRVTAF